MYKFKFADIGEGLHEGKVAEIFKKVGDVVEEGDSLFSVETDKVTSDIPSPVDGIVTKVLMAEGDTIHVGQDIYHLDDGSVDEAEVPEVKKEASKSAPASVVGDIKVSDNLFSMDMFKKVGAPKPTTLAKPTAFVSSSSMAGTKPVSKLDIKSIQAVGNGKQVDVVVIGAGPGGYTAAELLGKQGFKVVAVEKEKAGGVCLNVGCIPTKTLLKGTKVLQTIKEAEFYGIDIDIKSIKLNWKKMQARKVMVSETLSKGVEMIIKGAKAQYVAGEAIILDKHNVKVEDKVYTTKIIVLAAGSEPVMLNKLPGFQDSIDAEHLIDSTQALELDKIPNELVIIGGGVIGVEFAVLYSELGTKVTILEGGPSILGPLDGEVKKYATDYLTKQGVNIITNARVNAMDGQTVKYELDGKPATIKGDKILLSVGRRPLTLGVEKNLGVLVNDRGGIEVNADMQTSVSNIFAIGDVVGKSMLAHTAYKHAHILARAIEGVHTNLDMNAIPACVYTHPEIAVIGQTEEQLKENKVEYIKSVWQNTHVGKTLADGHTEGFTKLLVSKTTGEILGAHIINDTASDMIAELAAVKELEGTVYELAATIHPHPSISEAIYEAAVHAVEQLKKINK